MTTPRRPLAPFALLLALALLPLAGCGKSHSSSEPTPAPTPTPKTESFTGSFEQTGGDSHTFTTTVTGDVTIKLTSLAPLATMGVGLGVGTVDSTLTPPCALTATDRNAHVGDSFLSASLAAGTYCVVVKDVGNDFPGVTVTYGIDVTHAP